MVSYYLEPLLSSMSKIVLDQHKQYLCGSDESDKIDIRIDHPSVSRKHCIFKVTQNRLRIIDLGSYKGTFINGNKIPPNTLNWYADHDDIIGIASKGTQSLCIRTPHVYRFKLSGKKRKSDGDSTSVSEKIARSGGIVDHSTPVSSSNRDKKINNDNKKITPDNTKLTDERRRVSIRRIEKIIPTIEPPILTRGGRHGVSAVTRTVNHSDESTKKTLNVSNDSSSSLEEANNLNKSNIVDTIEYKKHRLKASLLTHEMETSIRSLPKTSRKKNVEKLRQIYNGRLAEAQFDLHAEPLKTNACQIEVEDLSDVVYLGSSTRPQIVSVPSSSNLNNNSNTSSEISYNDDDDIIEIESNMKNNIHEESVNLSRDTSKSKILTKSAEPKKFINSERVDKISKSCRKATENLPTTSKSINISRLTEPIQKKVTTQTRQSSFHKVHTHNESNKKPNDKIRSVFELPREFLLAILEWNPDWLDDRKYKRNLQYDQPFIREKFAPHLSAYVKYSDYHKIMSSLILMETWVYLMKSYHEKIEHREKNRVSIAVITQPAITTEKINEFTAMILCDKVQAKNKYYPKHGDLVILELLICIHERFYIEPIFALCYDVQKIILTQATQYDHCLNDTVHNPYALIKLTMVTKPLPHSVCFTRTHKLTNVFYLRPQLRMMQAVECLQFSPLKQHIVQPDCSQEAFILRKEPDYRTYKFVTGDKLNHQQMEAIVSIKKAIIDRSPKICLVEGPTGTGKSQVIVNILTEIMYDQNICQNNSRKRILVCAPSNAAVDTITLRLLKVQAKFARENSQELFKIVRVGTIRNNHPDINRITVTELANAELKNQNNHKGLSDESIEAEEVQLNDKISKISGQLNGQKQLSDYERILLQSKYDDYVFQLLSLDCNKLRNRNNNKYETFTQMINILTGADIVVTTLSSCYSYLMERAFGDESSNKFGVCIIDEASVCCEPNSLLPLLLGVKQLVLVGDSKQLWYATQSRIVQKKNYDKSLFSRIFERFEFNSDNPIITLNIQQRSVNEIIYWPNNFFYDRKLQSGITLPKQWPFYSYKVFELKCRVDNNSRFNIEEVNFIVNLIKVMTTRSSLNKINGKIRINVVTPSNNNYHCKRIDDILIRRFANTPDMKKKVAIEVNAVGNFHQDREHEILILLCGQNDSMRSLFNSQLLCQTLTSAKYTLFICGNFQNINDSTWYNLFMDARSRGVYHVIDDKNSVEDFENFIIKRFI